MSDYAWTGEFFQNILNIAKFHPEELAMHILIQIADEKSKIKKSHLTNLQAGMQHRNK
jgi:hypothetical protein